MQVTKEMIEIGARAICCRIGVDPDGTDIYNVNCITTNWSAYMAESEAAITAALSAMWQPIETAPHGELRRVDI